MPEGQHILFVELTCAVATFMPQSSSPAPDQKRRWRGYWEMLARSKSILVYDDDEVSGLELADVLRQAGYENVHVASHFTAALTVLEAKSSVDLLVADIVVPGGLSGIALARMARLRQPEVHVIFVTGYDVPDRDRLSWPILRKPVSEERLLAAVGRALG